MKIQDLHRPVYLFPFTAEAALMHYILKEHGIKTAGFLDNDKSLHSKNYDGIAFQAPLNASEKHPAATVVICGHRHYPLAAVVKALGFEPIEIERLLRSEDVSMAIPLIDKTSFEKLAPKQKDRLNRIDFEIKNVLLPLDKIDLKNGLVLNSVEFSITAKCTLKCRDCGAMMQYYANPKHYDLHQVIESIDLVMQKTDFIRNVSVIGGEPFIYPQLEPILETLGKYSERIGACRITTNGTVLPSDDILQAIKKTGVFVRISNYGELSKKILPLKEKLEKYNIPYQISDIVWYKMNHLIYGHKTGIQEKYDDCYSRIICHTVTNQRLYLCEFLAQAENLHAIPFDEMNHVRLNDAEKEDIRRYIENKTAPPGCAYCSGHDRNMDVVPAAEQIKEPLPYRIFDNYPQNFHNGQ